MILWFSSGGGGIGFLLEGLLERKKVLQVSRKQAGSRQEAGRKKERFC
jgi:hypothetical protein